MPFNAREQVLCGLGLCCVGAATVFYRRKQTTAFKSAYFLAWPVLGTGIILGVTPSDEQLMQRMEKAGLMDRESMEQMREEQRETFNAALDLRQAQPHAAQVLRDD